METEAKTNGKKREWVKNAAIVFLAVLLILTFFSNTILNRSLPEVATRDITSGAIAARIRVTGTVTANQNYQVSIEESRKVRSVMVKAGQEVSTGDVLFILSDSKSEELEAAEDTLRQLEKSYQEKRINSSAGDYAAENREIELAQQAMLEAQAELEKLEFDTAGYEQAEKAVEDSKAAVREAEREEMDLEYAIVDADNAITRAESERDSSGYLKLNEKEIHELRQKRDDAQHKLREANIALDAAKLIYGKEYNWIVARAENMIKQSKEYKNRLTNADKSRYVEDMRPTYVDRVMEMIRNSQVVPPDVYSTTRVEYDSTTTIIASQDIERYQTAYLQLAPNSSESKQKQVDQAQKDYDNAVEAYESAFTDNQAYARLQEAVELAEDAARALRKEQDEAKRRTEDLRLDQSDAEERLNELKGKKGEYDAAQDKVKSAAQAVDDKLFALEEKQKADGKTAQLDSLELRELSVQIERQKQKVEELDTNAAEKEITSPVSGVLQSVDITAGQTTTPKAAMATIELPDMGYILTATVPNEQARRVHTGDAASVANMYWGTQIDAVLTGVKADPKDPQNSKQLTFELTGDVTPGSSLTLSVGQKSAEYDFVVPNSALRSDSNGDFILVVVAKNSPLGDRYIATRVNVTKVAADDTLTAVTGALNAGDFVITTSTAPIKNGDRVRLADTQS